MRNEKKLYMETMDSPVGKISMISDGTALKGLWIEGQHYYMDSLSEMPEQGQCVVFEETKQWLRQYFSGEIPEHLPLLAPEGSPFRKRIWEILLEIPYGEVRTYGDIAKQIAEETGKKRMSAQAVGGAVGHNPISIIIPCHRVVGKDGGLVGYGGGLDKKTYLLGLEGWLDPEECGEF